MMVKLKTNIAFPIEYSPPACKRSSFWPKVFVIALRFCFVSFLNCLLKCASEIGPSPAAQPPPTPKASRLQLWNQVTTAQNRSLVPQGEARWWGGGWGRSLVLLLIIFLTHPTCKRPVSAPDGFCLTNGVSFLQRYDPGLVVVMVNLAVVIFYFQTELLLLSSVHQYVRLTFSVVAIILLLGLSFSFPFLSLCTLVWSLFIKRVLLRRDVSVCVRTAKISLNINF